MEHNNNNTDEQNKINKGKTKLCDLNLGQIIEYLNTIPRNHKFDPNDYDEYLNCIKIYLNSFPPGYQFDPTDQQIILDYLLPKINGGNLPLNLMHEVNIYKFNPDDLAVMYSPQGSKLGCWYFFTSREKKYRNGSRPNRKAGDGYWKATGADKCIRENNIEVGFRKALVFYQGKPPKGTKTPWIMHEFREAGPSQVQKGKCPSVDISMRLDDYVLCRIYKKMPSKQKFSRREVDDESFEEVIQEALKEFETSSMANRIISPPMSDTNVTNNVIAYDTNNATHANNVNMYDTSNKKGANHVRVCGTSNKKDANHVKVCGTSNKKGANHVNVYDPSNKNGANHVNVFGTSNNNGANHVNMGDTSNNNNGANIAEMYDTCNNNSFNHVNMYDTSNSNGANNVKVYDTSNNNQVNTCNASNISYDRNVMYNVPDNFMYDSNTNWRGNNVYMYNNGQDNVNMCSTSYDNHATIGTSLIDCFSNSKSTFDDHSTSYAGSLQSETYQLQGDNNFVDEFSDESLHQFLYGGPTPSLVGLMGTTPLDDIENMSNSLQDTMNYTDKVNDDDDVLPFPSSPQMPPTTAF